MFGFPQQFAALTPVLAEFVNEVCATPKLGSAPLLRGVYFTSGTQEGNPIDRVMGALARTFRVQARAALRPPGSGRAYFLTRLLRDVIFQEQGTLVFDPRRARRQHLWRYAGLAVSGALALFLLGGFTTSTIRNGLYVSEVSGQLPAVADGLKQMPRDLASPEALVKAGALLGTLQHAAVTSAIDPEQPPFSAGFGLFQGDKLAGAAGLAYRRGLQQVLLPAIDQSLEQHLAKIDDKTLDSAYDTLRVYIMVHDPAHYDAAAIRAWVLGDWDQRLPQAVPEEERSRLTGHLDALLTHGAVHSPRPANDALIQQARSALARDTLAGRIYGRIKRTPTDIALPEFTVVDAGGPSAALTFERASQQPLTRGIAGLFSVAGYLKVFRPAVPKVARQLTAEEPWVLGTTGKPQDLTRVASDVRQLYLDEYIKVWDGFLADVRVVRPASLQRTVELTRVLAQPDSPLTRLMRAVARETALLAATQAPGGDAGKAVNTAGDLSMQSRTFGMEANKVGRKIDELQRSANDLGKLANTATSTGTLAGGIPNDGAERIVDEHFAAVRQLTEGKPSGLDTLSGLMTELNSSLVAADAAVKAGGAPPNSAELQSKLKAASGGMPPVVQKMMDTVSGSGASQTQGAAIENWKKAWQSTVGELCGKAVAGRYPFVRTATRDVARDDFVQLFAPGGLIDDFFTRNLASSVDTTAHPWRFRTVPGAAPQGGSLAVFQSAAAIRDAFFRTGGGKGVGFRLDFKLVELADGVKDVTLDLDGQPLKFTQTNGLPMSAAWPGPNGGAGLRLQAGSGAGLQIEGPWAPLHLIDKADIEAGTQAERFKARLSVDGKKLAFEITAGSVLNPLRLKELSTFSCTAL